MKKAITAVLVLLCLVGMIILGGCSPKTQNFLIESPHKITITSISGENIEIIDEAIIQQVTNNITSIQFERGKSSKNTNGFGPIISWYDSNDDLIESISVMGDNTIMYNDYFWTVVDGSIDIENINELLSSHEVDSVDTPELNETITAYTYVEYETMSFDWPVYESADELIEACDMVVVGTVTNISFQVLDTRTGKMPESETEDMYCSLYTIYDIDIIETYKGNSKDKEQVRVIGGLEGAYVTEQLVALGQEQATIFVLEGLIEISEGETYLFMLHQYEDTLPTIVNVEQGIYNISDALSNGSKQDSEITVQEIISSFGADEW